MNTSGIRPLEFNVLVKQDEVSEKTKGGIYIPQVKQEQEEHAATKGVIVAVSPMAFNADIHPEDAPKPKAGDRVAWARHAGTFMEGADGHKYRIIKDKDVVAFIEVME